MMQSRYDREDLHQRPDRKPGIIAEAAGVAVGATVRRGNKPTQGN